MSSPLARCVSCSATSEAELFVITPGLTLCRKCIDSGTYAGRVFFDLLFVIQLRLRQSVRALRQAVVRRGSDVGWYHFLGEQNIGLSSSVYAVALLKQLDPAFPELRAAADTVRRGFRFDSETKDSGGWPMASIPDAILVEPTCYCAGQLISAGFLELRAPEVDATVRWLLSQQQEPGSWGPRRDLAASCYVTALVVRSLADWRAGLAEEVAQKVQQAIQRGLQWLVGGVNADGGWGGAPGRHSDLWHTAHVVRALLVGGHDESGELTSSAIDYLLKNRDDWSHVLNSSYEIRNGERVARATYVFHPRPIVAQTLLAAGVSPQHPAILTAVLETLQAQNPESGEWRYPGATRGTIFELCHNAACLREFAERASSVGSLVELHYQLNKVEAKLETTSQHLEEHRAVLNRVTATLGDPGRTTPALQGHIRALYSVVSGLLLELLLQDIRWPIDVSRRWPVAILFSIGIAVGITAVQSRELARRAFYLLLLLMVAVAGYAIVSYNIPAFLFSVVVAAVIAAIQLVAPLVIPALRADQATASAVRITAGS